MVELHAAFTDLDQALHHAPAPVKLATTQELQIEARDPRAELLGYSENAIPATPVQRSWQHSFPIVAHEGGMSPLDTETRESLDRLEKGSDDAALAKGIERLRTLMSAHRLSDNQDAMLDVSVLSILDDPDWGTGYHLSIDGPVPGGRHPCDWSIYLGWWKPDDPDDEDNDDSTGSAVGTSRHEAWATTPVGHPLAGTDFIVTSRDDSHK